jgi:starch-binding outer membrane protein, SusD/RagB family
MNTKKYILFVASVVTVIFNAGCTDWLNQEPLSNVTQASYFENLAQFQAGSDAIQSNCYGYATNFSSNESLALNYDMGSDLNSAPNSEISGTDGAPSSSDYYTNPYKSLRLVNNLINQGEAYSGKDDISEPMGQAYYFRAFWHFFLLKRYGGVAIATSLPSTDSELVTGARASRYEVAEQILTDLDKAISLLSATTKTSTGNDGHVDIEAACAFKARVCLFEGTWEKYNGRGSSDSTNGDDTTSGAGTTIPSNYPSVIELLTMAQTESTKFVSGGTYASEYSIWKGVETTTNYEKQSPFYYFCLEDAGSNPAGLTKASNNESIWRKVYDYSLSVYGGSNLTHTAPAGGSRKLMDMFLCIDGLPVNISPLFQGYNGLNSEFENRDSRMSALYEQIDSCYWSGEYVQANYSTTPKLGGANKYVPGLTSYSNIGYGGRKWCSEYRKTYYESADYNYIRLPELLLINAEATYELNGSITDDQLNKTINVIRGRAHIADLTNSLVSTYGLDMLQEIRRERAIELMGEGFRISDLCRWGIAEKELDRPTCSYYVSYGGSSTELGSSTTIYDSSKWTGYITTEEQSQSTYTAGMPKLEPGALIIETANNRIFSKKNYLQAIPTDQISLNPKLLQNPKW